MFSHLDDPDPPTPSATLASRLVAEGQRRRRRRARLVGGALVGVVILVSAVVLAPWGDAGDERGVIANEGSTSTTVTHESTSSTTAPPTTEGAGGLESIVVPGDWPSAPVFAAVTHDGDVVLSDPRSGDVLLTLLPADPLAPALDVSLAPNGMAVYVGDPFRPRVRAAAAAPARRARLGHRDRGGGGCVARWRPSRHRRGRGVLHRRGPHPRCRVGGGAVEDVVELAARRAGRPVCPRCRVGCAGRSAARRGRLPRGRQRGVLVDPETSAQRLGPSGVVAAVPGIGWGLGGPVTDEDIVVVESCCSLDANSYRGDSALVVVDLATGTEVRRVPFDGGYGDVVVGPSGDWLVLTGCCGVTRRAPARRGSRPVGRSCVRRDRLVVASGAAACT